MYVVLTVPILINLFSMIYSVLSEKITGVHVLMLVPASTLPGDGTGWYTTDTYLYTLHIRESI